MAETTAFAMKWLPPGSRYDRATAAQLKHEYEVGKSLDHPSIIKTYDFGNTSKDGAYMVMELFKTPNLKQQIIGQLDQPPLAARHDPASSAPQALEHMHERAGSIATSSPIIFWSTRTTTSDSSTSTWPCKIKTGLGKLFGNKTPVAGTHSYMSPEQIRGQACDARADIYSFGCMVYELITGKLPFTGTSSSELLNKHLRTKPPQINVLNKNVHADFADLVHRMLAKEPKDRPDSLKEFMRELKAGRVFQIKPKKPLPKAETAKEEED